MKTKDWGRGRRGGLLNRKGGYKLSSSEKGGLLERVGGFFEKGGLIEDLRYLCCIKCGTS